ncbi:LacI family DNA-binding transcriptional regulator [Bremerella sp. T1]|uniref:LacI family DNA-binding transcriptional regulator n=1 Tax=Bremerella sp. TYQ1 TaxID=3119568 RepID=UPI001CCFECAA|nr:LacI family DNA-binding transcriptional regulator [Bremerella volcania]UBM37088.1 LacI family transcriptional regulator [Bremerella volcania]
MAKKSGRTAVRMKDVAEMAGVSRMAASAVLMGTGNGRIRVSEETAESIRKAAKDLGYRPNIAAQQLAGKRSNVVALVVRETRNFLTQKVTAELQREAEEHGLRLLSVGSYPSTDGLQRVVQDLDAGWVDGVMYLAHENEEQWDEVAELFKSRDNVLTVLENVGRDGVCRVISDVRTGAKETIDHLVSTGRKRVALLTEQRESLSILDRIEAYREFLEAHGMELSEEQIVVDTKGWLVNDPTTFPRFDDICRRLVDDVGADAILCDTDFNAVAVCRALRRLNYHVPDKVAVIGWHDLQFSSLLDPPLTTVAHDLPALLKAAVNVIQSDDAEKPGEVLVPTKLRIRHTS